jgi:hypothetical protein
MERLDLTNKRFNKLLVIERVNNQNHKTMWRCLCDCGNETFVITSNLTCNRVKSCGCLKNEQLIKRSTTHNQRHTNLYEVWKTMKQRCSNPSNSSYKNYGGRGINVCDEWKNNFISFYNWSMLNGYKKGLTIDRINNNSNYCPENCRWVDRKVQANNSRWNKHITINGKDDTLANWLRFYNLKYYKYYQRVKKGLTEQQALTQS